MWKKQAVLCGAATLVLTSAAPQKTTDGCECESECEAHLTDFYTCDSCYTKDKCGSWSIKGRWGYCSYSADPNFESKDFKAKSDTWWQKITANTNRATNYPSPLGILKESIQTSFDNYNAEFPEGREKKIHSIGSICKFDLDIKDSPFTGLLGNGKQEGFIRMGSASDYKNGGLTPGLGFKFPRTGVQSGDFVALHSLDLGQSWNFFKYNQSNHISPPAGTTAIIAKKFNQASQCAPQVGISDLARFTQDGTEHAAPKFPFKLFLVPSKEVQMDEAPKTVDQVHEAMAKFPVGTTLFSVYGCNRAMDTKAEVVPTEGGLEVACGDPVFLGDMVTTSQCTTSKYGDTKFQIRHQRIEEDWQLEPSYMRSYDAAKACGTSSVTLDGAPKKCGQEGMLATDVLV